MAKKILEPQLPNAYRTVSEEGEGDGEFYQVEFSHQTLKLTEQTLFSSCKLTHVELELTDESVSEFTDCVFEKCDFSNLKLSKIGFYRCIFKQCKLLGTDFTDGHFQEVQFEQNLLRYANFSGSSLKSVRFAQNENQESFFIACRFSNVHLIDNHLEGANFWETNLAGIDFSSNIFDHLEASPELLKGIKINLSQAPFFTNLLGIEII